MHLLAADTTLVCHDQILGKPQSLNDYRRMLVMLSKKICIFLVSKSIFSLFSKDALPDNRLCFFPDK